MKPLDSAPPVIFEDEHLMVVNKPAGLNTHAPSPFAGEGIYEWLRHREPRWASLAIIHRLDKETSGVMVFAKTSLANRSLTEQFARREIRKKYLLLTDRTMRQQELIAESRISRAGEKYVSGAQGELAQTRFHSSNAPFTFHHLQSIEAFPLTGRTHQIRVQAAENGFPILGDALYGGKPFARVCLHAAEITLRHPAGHDELRFQAPVDFFADARLALRASLIDPANTNACRLLHGASDGWPGWYVERLGDFLLSHSDQPLTEKQAAHVQMLNAGSRGVYHKILTRQIRQTKSGEASPQPVFGESAPDRFVIQENRVHFELSFSEGYSVGLFLDQRDNRRRLLIRHIAADFPVLSSPAKIRATPEILNTFAYTCGFSVCAALAGARTTSLDLSKKYLEWGKRNFALNGLKSEDHDFIYGDTFDWLKRLAKKRRAFDAVLLDPPTFSQSKEHGAFRAEKDFGKLVRAALPVLKSGGILFASTNTATISPEEFLKAIGDAIHSAGRKVLQKHYVPQPPDFPITRTEPGYLKTVWLRIS